MNVSVVLALLVACFAFDSAQGSVSCGGHRASSCPACPGENGKYYCNGDCTWRNNGCEFKGMYGVCTKTKAGNAGGACCKFPFKWNGKTYTRCSLDNGHTKPWCYTTKEGYWGYCVAGPAQPSVDKVLEILIKRLQTLKNDANSYYSKHGGRRNELALEASTNNLQDANELRTLSNSKVPNRLNALYKHTKEQEHQFNKVWGGDDNTYAGYCHGQAKKAYYHAILQCKALGETITNTNAKMVAIFQNLASIPGANQFEKEVSVKSGYARTTKVESELHTKIAAQVDASMNKLVARVRATVSAEIRAALKGSVAIQNTAERTDRQRITLDLTSPVYVYQVQYSSVMADGSTLASWGAGWIVSPKPIA